MQIVSRIRVAWMSFFAELVLHGVLAGAIYALIGLGLIIAQGFVLDLVVGFILNQLGLNSQEKD